MLPSELFQKNINNNAWEKNPAQHKLMQQLDAYTKYLNANSILKKYRRKKHGIYVWGSVGSGKTTMLNMFYDLCTSKKKQRLHFHEFITKTVKDIHQLQGQKDPVTKVIKQLAATTDILFVDEFLVNDIGHATILKKIISACVKYKIFIITTANSPPKDSYKGVINKHLFNPAVEAIEKEFAVIELDSDIDYRNLNHDHNHNYFHPNTKTTAKLMADMFTFLSDGNNAGNKIININNRDITTLANNPKCIWFNYMNIIKSPRTHADFIIICERYNAILISQVRPLKANEKDLIINFCHFIDICYHKKIRLVMESSCSIDNLFAKDATISAIPRTISRIKEMQIITA
ncbi:MAG: cell division protein ZapE [Legionellales bacterium]|jgi:cell division protein ZapE|nr:cell division protein ZapE [Legionellales bacterium]